MTIDFSTSEMKAAWDDARWLLINIAVVGYELVNIAANNLTGAKSPPSALSWFLIAVGCFCLLMSVACGRRLFRNLASVHRRLAKERVLAVSALAFACGSAFAGAQAWGRAAGFSTDAIWKLSPATLSMFALVAFLWLVSTALVPLLLNHRSLQ